MVIADAGDERLEHEPLRPSVAALHGRQQERLERRVAATGVVGETIGPLVAEHVLAGEMHVRVGQEAIANLITTHRRGAGDY